MIEPYFWTTPAAGPHSPKQDDSKQDGPKQDGPKQDERRC